MTPVTTTRAELADSLKDVRERGGRVALVPTMGALHAGHGSLMRQARRVDVDVVVVSIFVNPTQFAAGEDLARYPRSLEADVELCDQNGVDLVFAPSVDQMYPAGDPQVTVDPGPLGSVLEGVSRPTHFRGVLTVVAKLFEIVRPDVAVFGEKDFQQLTLIRQMATDLCMPVEIVGAPTVREGDGLAMSSRNRYLTDDERRLAVALSQALDAGAAAAREGVAAVRRAAAAVFESAAGVDVDYLEVTSVDLTSPPASGAARLLVAARVGSTRLIDNIGIDLGDVGRQAHPGSA